MKLLRLEEPLPITTDEVDRETPASDVLAGIPPPPAAAHDANGNADLVTDTQPSTGAAWVTGRWTPEEDAELTNAVVKTKKKRWGKAYKLDWVAIAALVPGRTNLQCRKRWKETLNPSIALTAGSAGIWTAGEDLKLKAARRHERKRARHGDNIDSRVVSVVKAENKVSKDS
jgi:hypothetical protein